MNTSTCRFTPTNEKIDWDGSIGHPVILKDNQDSTWIYRLAQKFFHENRKNYPLEQSVFALFFDDIAKILTSIQLKRNDLEGPFPPRPEIRDLRSEDSFYIDYQDLLGNFDITQKKFPRPFFPPTGGRQKILSLANFLLSTFSGNNPKVAICGSHLDTKNILRSGYCVSHRRINKVCIDEFKLQLRQIENLVEQTAIQFNWGDSLLKIVNQVVASHIKAIVADSHPESLDCEIYLTGTLGDLKNRVGAFRAKQQKIPVVSVHQTYCSDAVYDNGYHLETEYLLADVILGVGARDRFPSKRFEYTQWFREDRPIFIPSTKNSGERNLSLRNFAPSKDRFLYVADSMAYRHRYGPRWHINQELYLDWQKHLISEICHFDLTIKKHIKGDQKYRKMTVEELASEIGLNQFQTSNLKFETAPFEDVFHDFDVLIFDTCGNAFNKAIGSNLPIIYFDFGKMGFSEQGRKLLEERCHVFRIDLTNPPSLTSLIESAATTVKTNSYLDQGLTISDFKKWVSQSQLNKALKAAENLRITRDKNHV